MLKKLVILCLFSVSASSAFAGDFEDFVVAENQRWMAEMQAAVERYQPEFSHYFENELTLRSGAFKQGTVVSFNGTPVFVKSWIA